MMYNEKFVFTKATGSFLATYYSDLEYISKFQLLKQNKISNQEFEKIFYRFLKEFKITRNFIKGKTNSVLQCTLRWLNHSKPNDVDAFAKYLKEKKLTHNNTATVLCSKILFLNNPWEILPMDKWGKKTLGLRQNNYKEYLKNVKKFKQLQSNAISNNLKKVNSYLISIEDTFKKEIEHIKIVRENRFIDKLLWTQGQKLF